MRCDSPFALSFDGSTAVVVSPIDWACIPGRPGAATMINHRTMEIPMSVGIIRSRRLMTYVSNAPPYFSIHIG